MQRDGVRWQRSGGNSRGPGPRNARPAGWAHYGEAGEPDRARGEHAASPFEGAGMAGADGDAGLE